jgi:hypothetical protein
LVKACRLNCFNISCGLFAPPTAVIFFYISNEGISLLENTVALGLPVPDQLKNVLAQLHGKSAEPKGPTPADPTPIPTQPEPVNPPAQQQADPGTPQKTDQEDE